MGILQKSSLRLTLGFMLAFTISVLLNIGFSTSSSAASSYVRINNQTVKWSVTADVPGQSVVAPTYYVSEGLATRNAKFWSIKEASNNTTYCQQWIDMSINGAPSDRWTRSNIRRTSPTSCSDKTVTDKILVNDAGANIFFYKGTDGVIRPALTISSAFEFKPVITTTGLRLNPPLKIYIQTSPTDGIVCPRLLLQYSLNSWAFIGPFDTKQAQTNKDSKYYQLVMANAGIGGVGNCNANSDQDVKVSTEQSLAQLIGGTTTDWGTSEGFQFPFMNFLDFRDSTKRLGIAVGDPSAAEIRLKTTPAGSIDGSVINKDQTGADLPKTTCAIDGIGWIVCPVVNFMAKIADGAFSFLATNFLETRSSMFDTNTPTYLVWQQVRNIANALFVIAFMVIIFSQMTSVGITNYGVKRMLPRLVVAAILVNVSYYACQLAIDVSNILGYSIKNMFASIPTAADAKFGIVADQGGQATGAGFFGLAGGILAGTAGLVVLYLMLGTLIPVLLASVVALVMILFILITRQALIVMLVIISPLAFVAYLLPNTEQWFKKWQKTFVAMLLLFPIIALVFGASSLASGVITATFNNTGSGSNIAADTNNWFGSIVGAAVAVLPLFIVPGLLKKSLDSVGGIGAKINGIGAKMGGTPGKKLTQAFGDSRMGQYKKYRQGEGARKRAQVQSGTYEGGNWRPSAWGSGLNKKLNESKLSGAFGTRATSQGAALADAEDAELVKNAGSRLDYFDQPNGNPLSQEQMLQIATGKDVTDISGRFVAAAKTFDVHTRKAAILKAGKIATVAEAQQLVDASGKDAAGKDMMTAGERLTLVSALAGSSAAAKAPYLVGQTLGDITQGTATSDKAALRALTQSKINAEALAGGDKHSVEKLLEVAMKTDVGSKERTNLKAAYAEYIASPRLHERVVAGGDHDIRMQSIVSL